MSFSEREIYTLKELNCKFLSGFAFKSSDYRDSGIPLIKIGNIQNRHVEINSNGTFVSKELINNKTNKFLLKRGDVLIAMTGQGSVGRVGKLKLELGDKAFLNQRVGKLLCDNVTLNIDYLYYSLVTEKYQKLLFNMGVGSGQPNLSPEQILSIKLPYLSLDVQHRIAAILSSLDDAIELNQQTNKTLEEIAQTLFKEMCLPKGGELPEGWRIGKLGEIIQNFDSRRKPLSSRERENRKGIYPYYGAASIFDYIDDYLFDGIYLLLGEDGTVITEDEKPVLQYVSGKFWVNNHAHILQGKDYYSTEFSYLLLKNTNIKSLVTGAVQPKINQGNMNNLEIILPDKETVLKLQNIVTPIFESILDNEQENKTLSALRDLLLPKLMKGEINLNGI
jgi:type I restriction enzyme S subunit